MKRSRRLANVDAVIQESEREAQLRLAALQTRLTEAEQRCEELRRYLGEYEHAFGQRARRGIGAAGVRDYQHFMARLREAVQQQDGLVHQLRGDCERARSEWRDAAARSKAVSKVIARARAEEQQVESRRQQREQDEHAQRLAGLR